jgi:hypothetical protein
MREFLASTPDGIAGTGGARAADGAAIDSRGEHTNEELAIESRIARESRPRTNLMVEFHSVG